MRISLYILIAGAWIYRCGRMIVTRMPNGLLAKSITTRKRSLRRTQFKLFGKHITHVTPKISGTTFRELIGTFTWGSRRLLDDDLGLIRVVQRELLNVNNT